jgi:POT family proton-dependent oligopeptide transporter
MVRKIYEGDDSKIDSAFTIYYMAVNIGSMVSMLLTPWIKDYVNTHYGYGFGWHAAFAVSCVGLAVGLSNYFVMHHTLAHIGSEPDSHPLQIRKLGVVLAVGIVIAFLSTFVLKHETVARVFMYAAAAIVFSIFTFLIYTGHRSERAGLIVVLVLTIQTIFFFIFYQQMSTSLALFVLRNVDWNFNVFGFHLFTWAPAQFQALNPIWIFIFSPILAWLYRHAGSRGRDLSIAGKFAIGFAMIAVSFFIYGSAEYFAGPDGKISSWVMVWGYGFGALSELLVSGLGLAMIAHYVPARMSGFMMGAYFIASGISQYLGGWVATLASVPKDIINPLATLSIYTRLFNWLGVAGIACTLMALAVLPLIRKLSRRHKESVKGWGLHSADC